MEQEIYQYPVYGSQTVIPYLSDHLQNPAYTIEVRNGEHGREHLFSSNYIDIIMTTRDTLGLPKSLLSVLKLIDVSFDKREPKQKADICADGLLAILSGTTKAKYGEAPISRATSSPLQEAKNRT